MDAPAPPPASGSAPIEDNAFGINGTLFRVEALENDRGPYKVIFVRRDDGRALVCVLYGKALRNFEEGGFKDGDEIRVFGEPRGHHTVHTAEFGPLDAQAFRARWVGRPNPAMKGPRKPRTARPPAPVSGPAPAPAAAEPEPAIDNWAGPDLDDGDPIPF